MAGHRLPRQSHSQGPVAQVADKWKWLTNQIFDCFLKSLGKDYIICRVKSMKKIGLRWHQLFQRPAQGLLKVQVGEARSKTVETLGLATCQLRSLNGKAAKEFFFEGAR